METEAAGCPGPAAGSHELGTDARKPGLSAAHGARVVISLPALSLGLPDPPRPNQPRSQRPTGPVVELRLRCLRLSQSDV